MNFLILDTYYPQFLDALYSKNHGLASLPYAEQMNILMACCFGTADFYSTNLRTLGHEAQEIITNCEPIQIKWAEENGLRISKPFYEDSLYSLNNSLIKGIRRLRKRICRTSGKKKYLYSKILNAIEYRLLPPSPKPWLLEILAAQIKQIKPDILYIQERNIFDDSFIKEIKADARLVIGQIATKIPPERAFDGYDLMVSSLPNIVDLFRDKGQKSAYLRLAFEPKILDRLDEEKDKKKNIVHIGGYGEIHEERDALLESVAGQYDIDFWGYGTDDLEPDSVIVKNYHGEAWGMDMYRVRRGYHMTLTKHITSVADGFANNATLFEATGVGNCLITDMKSNLNDMFIPDKEVLVYKDTEECLELIGYYLKHDDERESIARAGQQRTLQEHTYLNRMQELIDIVQKYI